MNPALLHQHFDRVSEAPDAIPRLRQLILDLAVRGKLLEQDPKDEPASELLKHIEEEKERLLKEGKIKKIEKFASVEAREIPFAIPLGWQVIRMGSLALKLGAGSTPLGGQAVYQSEGIQFLRSQNIYNDGLRLDDVAFIPRSIHERMSGTHVQKHDLLLNITGASIGRCAIVPETFTEGNVSQHVAIVRLFSPNMHGFIHLSLISPFFQELIDDVQVGMSREGLSMQRLKLFPLLIPPLAEQRRIVAKVDELMLLCDQLETVKVERERSRNRLVAASLHCLNFLTAIEEDNAPTAFREHASFYFNYLPRLTTCPEHIKQLRQTILNLAVRGKLVPQDLNDEAVTKQLKRIHSLKEHLTSKGKIRRQEQVTLIEDGDIPFEVPATWRWVRLAAILASSFYGPRFGADEYSYSGIPTIRTTDMTTDGRIVLHDPPKVNVPPDRLEDFKCEKGDLLITRTGSIGTMAVFTGDYLAIPSAYLIRLRFTVETWVDYIHCLLRSPYGQSALGLNVTKVAQPNINAKSLAAILIPLPPLAEQRRIVAKVDNLIALCNELEAQLITTETDSRRFLEAILDQALGTTLYRASPQRLGQPYEAQQQKYSDNTFAQEPELPDQNLHFMNTNPVKTITQMVECLTALSGAAAPERLLNATGLGDDVDKFFDLLREGRDLGLLSVPTGSNQMIRRNDHAD